MIKMMQIILINFFICSSLKTTALRTTNLNLYRFDRFAIDRRIFLSSRIKYSCFLFYEEIDRFIFVLMPIRSQSLRFNPSILSNRLTTLLW